MPRQDMTQIQRSIIREYLYATSGDTREKLDDIILNSFINAAIHIDQFCCSECWRPRPNGYECDHGGLGDD